MQKPKKDKRKESVQVCKWENHETEQSVLNDSLNYGTADSRKLILTPTLQQDTRKPIRRPGPHATKMKYLIEKDRLRQELKLKMANTGNAADLYSNQVILDQTQKLESYPEPLVWTQQ